MSNEDRKGHKKPMSDLSINKQHTQQVVGNIKISPPQSGQLSSVSSMSIEDDISFESKSEADAVPEKLFSPTKNSERDLASHIK